MRQSVPIGVLPKTLLSFVGRLSRGAYIPSCGAISVRCAGRESYDDVVSPRMGCGWFLVVVYKKYFSPKTVLIICFRFEC